MRYASSVALRVALEHRLLVHSMQSGVSLDRLRRRVVFERIAARLTADQPGRWVIKGGMALECRLRDDARLTKDLDLGLRDSLTESGLLHDQLTSALDGDPDGDTFKFACAAPFQLQFDGAGALTWRTTVAARLAGKEFGRLQLDVSPREYELVSTEHVTLPNSLDFADIPPRVVEIIDVHRHAAEKFHGMLRDFGDRENSRVRDLVDLVILIEHRLLDPRRTTTAVAAVWAERDQSEPPTVLPDLPASWPTRYAVLARELGLAAIDLTAARELVRSHWHDMQQVKEN